MAKKGFIPHDQYLAIQREASEVAETISTPGWKIIEEQLLQDAGRIEEQLAENRLRTIHETIQDKTGTRTFITTAETQIAENAGMYKQIKQLFTTIETIIDAPTRIAKLEQQGVLVIDKAAADTKTDPSAAAQVKQRVSKVISAIRDRVHALRPGGEQHDE
jgi:hypothetical protein